jgi:hypothetical protein
MHFFPTPPDTITQLMDIGHFILIQQESIIQPMGIRHFIPIPPDTTTQLMDGQHFIPIQQVGKTPPLVGQHYIKIQQGYIIQRWEVMPYLMQHQAII